jgi:hypothetical protein
MGCGLNICGKCHAWKKVVTGLLLLLNAFVWPLWVDLSGWIAWFAVLMVVGGVLMLFKPNGCGHCTMTAPASSSKKKR